MTTINENNVGIDNDSNIKVQQDEIPIPIQDKKERNNQCFQTLMIILDKLNIYSTPTTFLYKQKNQYKTIHGIFYSMIIIAIFLMIIIDYTYYYLNKDTCPSISSSLIIDSSQTITFNTNTVLFLSIFNREASTYLSYSEIIDTLVLSFIINKNKLDVSTLTIQEETDIIKMVECNKQQLANYDKDFAETFDQTILCPELNELVLKDFGNKLYDIRLVIEKGPNPTITNGIQLQLGLSDVFFEKNKNRFVYGYNIIIHNFDDNLVPNDRNSWRTTIQRKVFTEEYSFNKDQSNIYYSFDRPLESRFTKKYLYELQLLISTESFKELIKEYPVILMLGIVFGWVLYLYIIGNYIIRRFIRFNLYKSLSSKLLNIVSPENIPELAKEDDIYKKTFILEEHRQLDVLTSMIYKYTTHSKISFSIIEKIMYLFCCNCLKSAHFKQKELTIITAFKQLFFLLDIVNIAQNIHEVEQLKEYIFQPYQRKLFEEITRPIITSDKTHTVFNLENESITEKKSLKERNRIILKEALNAFQGLDYYDKQNSTMLNLLGLEEEYEIMAFDQKKKAENVENRFKSIFLGIENNDKATRIDNYHKLFLEKLDDVKRASNLNKYLLEKIELSQKEYIYLYDQNQIFKKLLNDDLLCNTVIISSDTFSKNKIRKNVMYYLIKANNLLWYVIDSILFINWEIENIIQDYNKPIIHAFINLRHCIRIILIFTITYLYFFIRAVYFNSIPPKCKSGPLCVGFLSYYQKPNDIFFTYTISGLMYLLVLMLYTFCLILIHFLTVHSTNEYTSDHYLMSKELFSSVTMKLKSNDKATNYLSSLIESLKLMYNISKTLETQNLLRNNLILIFNIIGCIVHPFIIIGAMWLFKTTSITDYQVKLFVLSFCLGMVINIITIGQYYACEKMLGLKDKQMRKYKSVIPLISKFLAFTIVLFTNYFLLFNRTSSRFFGSLYLNFEKEEFICREDQSAINLFWFITFEFVCRKLIMIIFSLTTMKKDIEFPAELMTIDTLCLLYFISITLNVFPLIGVLGLIFLIADFHLSYFILRKCRSFYRKNSTSDLLSMVQYVSLMIIICFYMIIKVMFHNQYALFENVVPEISKDPILHSEYPAMCRHQKFEDDFQWQWSAFFPQGILYIYLTALNCILIPLIFGIGTIIYYSQTQMKHHIKHLRTVFLNGFNPNPNNNEEEQLEEDSNESYNNDGKSLRTQKKIVDKSGMKMSMKIQLKNLLNQTNK